MFSFNLTQLFISLVLFVSFIALACKAFFHLAELIIFLQNPENRTKVYFTIQRYLFTLFFKFTLWFSIKIWTPSFNRNPFKKNKKSDKFK